MVMESQEWMQEILKRQNEQDLTDQKEKINGETG